MIRRDVLKWLTRGLGAATAAVIGLPGVRYVLGTLEDSPAGVASRKRVARLADLSFGKPVQVVLQGSRRDAWVTHANEVIGRIWLVRRNGAEGNDGPPRVAAFTSICPHMGCQIQLHAGGDRFVCPCHRAAFAIDGARIDDPDSNSRNHAPRGMDGLECRVVSDASTGEEWVEVHYERFEGGLTRKTPKA